MERSDAEALQGLGATPGPPVVVGSVVGLGRSLGVRGRGPGEEGWDGWTVRDRVSSSGESYPINLNNLSLQDRLLGLTNPCGSVKFTVKGWRGEEGIRGRWKSV